MEIRVAENWFRAPEDQLRNLIEELRGEIAGAPPSVPEYLINERRALLGRMEKRLEDLQRQKTAPERTNPYWGTMEADDDDPDARHARNKMIVMVALVGAAVWIAFQ